MKIKNFVPKISLLGNIVIYFAFVIFTYILSFYLRLSFKIDTGYWQMIIKTLPLLICIKMVIFGYYGFFSDQWSYLRIDYIWKLLKTHVLAMVSFITGVVFIYTVNGFPRSIFVLDCIFSFCLVSGIHFTAMLFRKKFWLVLVNKNKGTLIGEERKAGILFWIEAQLKNVILFDICFFVLFSPLNKSLTKVCVCIGIVLWIIVIIIEHKSNFYKNLIPSTPLNKSLIFFLISAIISVMFSIDPGKSQEIFFGRYLFYVFFFWISYAIIGNSKRNLNFILLSLFILGSILGVGAMRDYVLFRPRQLSTVFNIRLYIASYLTFLVPLSCTVFFSRTKIIFKYFSLASTILLIPMFIFHASRGVWIAVMISLIVVSLFARIKYKILFYSLIIIGLFFLPKLYQERAKTILDPFKQTSIIVREELYTSAIDIFKAHPFLGAGLGMYGKLFKNGSSGHLHVHNIYLEIAAEMGIIGLLAFLSILFVVVKKFIKNLFDWANTGGTARIVTTAAGASIFASFISNLSTSSIIVGFQDAVMFWLLLAFAVNDDIVKIS